MPRGEGELRRVNRAAAAPSTHRHFVPQSQAAMSHAANPWCGVAFSTAGRRSPLRRSCGGALQQSWLMTPRDQDCRRCIACEKSPAGVNGDPKFPICGD